MEHNQHGKAFSYRDTITHLFVEVHASCLLQLVACYLLRQPCLPDHPILYPQPMRWHSEVAAGLLFHAAAVNAFSRCLGRLPADGTGTASSRRRLTKMMSAPLPGLFGRKPPLGLGSWRVESVVDSQEPNSMFVFLFDDGSGEGRGVVQADLFPLRRISEYHNII